MPPPLPAELTSLASLFYAGPEELGCFHETTADALDDDHRRLLAHEHHMTVTVEAFHGARVDVRVLRVDRSHGHYAREILLTLRPGGRVVQYGVMRIDFAYVSDEVRREIEAESAPLGNILIEHGVLRRIRLLHLWRIDPAPALCRALELPAPTPVFGRTALIECNREPAIELLEIVSPPS